MSFYPRFNTNSNTFNSQDVISYEETSAGNTVVSLDLSSFVQSSNPTFNGELYLKENVGVNFNGKKQSTAFTDEYKTDLEQNKEKLTSINYANSKTTVLEELDLTGATVSLNDDQIDQSKITNLVTRLTDIDTNLANINSNDNDIAILNTTTANHNAQLTSIESKNDTQDDRLTTLETDTENITIRITDAETDITNLEATDTQHDASLNELFGITSTLTNDVISLTNMDTDISTNLNTYKVSNGASILSINNDISAIQSVDVGQNSRLDSIETLNITQNSRLDSIETLNISQDSRLDAVESKNVIQDASLNSLQNLTSSHTTDLSNLSALQNANIDNITTLQGENVSQDGRLSTLEGQIITKHPTINNANKLNATYVGNGDVSNDKLSALNDVRTDVSIQNQINTINDSISGLDALQDLDLINIPILQSDVAGLKAKDVNVDASLNSLATDIASNVSDIATNATNVATNTASINTTNTNVNNNANSISTLNTNVASLVSADGIHDSQISDLQSADTVLQANIDLKEDIISLTNKLNSTKIFDTGLNDSLDALLSTIDNNINLLNSSKQDNITTLNKLNSNLLNRNDNLQYVDVTSSIQTQINNINSNISLLQGTDTTIISDIQANFDTHDASITANTNAISTLQGLQDGDVISFQNINNSITNLTNTKHPLIDTNNKLNSSLLNRDDNLQHIDITSSLQTKLNNLDVDIATKQNVIDNANKLDATLLNLNNNLQYADYGSSVTTKFASIDNQIVSLSNNDVNQVNTNTNLQNQINTNASAITDLETFETNQLATNTTLQNNINLKQNTLTNSSSVAFVDITSGLQSSLNTLQNNIDNIDLSSKQDVLINASNLSYVDITSGLQSSLNTLQNNIDNLNPQITMNDLFYNYKENMPSIPNSKTVMNFTINGENYQTIQSSYFGVHSGGSQTDSWSMQNLFDNDETSLFRIGYYNNWFYNESDVLVKYNTYQYNVNGDYIGNLLQQDYNTLSNYTGEYIEFRNPFYFKPTSVYMKANIATQMVLTTYVMGSNDNVNYELIDTISTGVAEEITFNFTTTEKYKTLKFIFNKSAIQQGITLKTMTLSGVKTSYLLTDAEQIVLNTANISTNTTDIATNTANISTNATNISANTASIISNTTNIATNTANISTNATNISANTTNIATNTTNIQNNLNSIGTINTNITNLQNQIDNIQTKTELFGTTNYDDTVNKITHTYDEKNLFIDPLDDNNLMELDLTITTPANGYNYKQVLTINCLEFKSYVNVLKINGIETEIKHRDGDTNINLAPIAGYSIISQTLDMTRIGNTWYVMSNIELFYNSVSNTAYDVTPPVITVLGDTVVNHEINSGAYTDAGATATDNIDGDMTGSIVVSGDTVDVAVLGVYNIYYNVSDGIPNAAIQKTRVVNVVDTTNPVVVLIGDAEVTINQNDTYTELGATASDNSLETINVIIGGNTVDTAIIGDYTVLYTATDSTGNTHQIGRLVHVISTGLTLQWDNPATDIFTLINAYSHNSVVINTENIANVTTGEIYLQGNYIYHCSTIQNNSSYMRNIFNNSSNIYASMTNGNGLTYTSHIYGNMTGFAGGSDYPFDRYGTGDYDGCQMNNGTFNGLVYFSHIDSNTSIDYAGEFLEAIFPFYVDITSVNIESYSSTFTPEVSHLMGSTDGGITYQLIETYGTPVLNRTTNYSGLPKYNGLKYIMSKCTESGYVMAIKNWKLYGKIYK